MNKIICIMVLFFSSYLHADYSCIKSYQDINSDMSSDIKHQSFIAFGSNIIFYITPIWGTFHAAYDTVVISNNVITKDDVEDTITLYNQSMTQRGSEFDSLVSELNAQNNKDLLAEVVYDLFDQGAMCDEQFCGTISSEQTLIEMQGNSRVNKLHACTNDEAKILISTEYFNRLKHTN